MNVSDSLKSQLDRLQKVGAYSLSTTQKEELRDCLDAIGARPLTNLACGVCVRNSMYELINYLKQVDEKPKLHFKAVKNPEDLSYKELRDTVKAKGLLKKHMKKEEMIKVLKDV